MSKIRVAVIGAGAAGLCTIRHLTSRHHIFDVTAFEQGAEIGGIWVFTQRTGIDENGLSIHGSMYKNLRTNLPKEAMAFPDYNFDKNLPSFVYHSEVLNYLKGYCDHFDLRPHIQFQRIVVSVEPFNVPMETSPGQGHRWHVTSAPVTDRPNTRTEEFDAVIVCTGHYSVPLMPNYRGLESFPGDIIHSHDYRYPEHFLGQTVLCLGGGVSGVDISIDIAPYAKQVYLCHNKPRIQSELPPNMQQKPGISHIEGASVFLNDGQVLHPDCLLLCTGYEYSFPFLSPKCNLHVADKRVMPLYKHLIHTEYATLSFIGVIFNICPFQQFNMQAQFVVSVLDGTLKLPSKEEMDADTERESEEKLREGLPSRYLHYMGGRQWEYSDELARLAGCEPIAKRVRNLFDHVHATRVKNYLNFKNINYCSEDFE